MRTPLILASILMLAACSSSTEVATGTSLVGRWRYAGLQTSGAAVSYTGRLDFVTQKGQAFDGNYAVEARDAQGVVQLVTGFVSGTFVDAAAVDFDVTASGATIRHVARVRNDSLVGTWFSSSGSNGSFTAVREASP